METDKYQQIQILDYQIKQLQKVVESIDTQLLEISSTVDSLKEFEKLKSNDEVLFPIANGIFAKGKLTDSKMLRINVGSNVVVDKTIAETIKMMEKQSIDIENYKKEVVLQLQKFIDKIQELQG